MGKPSGDLASVLIQDKISGASREIPCKAGEAVKMRLGGYKKERKSTGNGGGHAVHTMEPWQVSGIMGESDTGVLEFLQGLRNSAGDAIFVFTWVNGDVYKGTGNIEGDLEEDKYEGFVGFTAAGSGVCEKLA